MRLNRWVREPNGLLLLMLMFVLGKTYGQPAVFSPINPKVGDTVRVSYNPQAKYASLLRTSAVLLHALVLPELGSAPTLLEVPLKKNGETWSGEFVLQPQGARYVLYEFISDDLKDDNRGQGWNSMVLGADGKPQKGSHYWRAAASAFGGHMGFKHTKDVSVARKELAEERRLFPENYAAVNLTWYLEMNPLPTEAGKARIKKDLAKALKQFRNTEEALPILLVWFEQVGSQKKTDSLRKVFVGERPKGKVAAAMMMREVSNERDVTKRIALLEHYRDQFPLSDEEALTTNKQILAAHIQAEKFDKAYDILHTSPKLDVALYKNLAGAMLEKGKELGKAIDWTAEAISLTRNQDPSSKPSSQSSAESKRSQARTLSSLLGLRGAGLMKLKKHHEAIPVLEEAFGLSEENDPETAGKLLESYVTANEFQRGLDFGMKWVGRWKTNVAMIGHLKTAYTKVHGSLSGYDKAVQKSKADATDELLKRGLEMPAPNFVLKDPSGATVRLSDLRGKVVVLQFWSTWSGQSRELFPHLQKVVEQYRDYRTVSILGINTVEGTTTSLRDSAIARFLKETKSSAQVLVDDGSMTSQEYAVEGVPTRYVIDKKGIIRFKSTGFRVSDRFVNDLTDQIEVLLKH